MRLIGVCGKSHSGKDTVADILVRDHGFTKISLADPMKRACAEWFGWSTETLWGPSSARNEPHARLGGLSARKALQLLGTEFGRACYEDIWVDQALRIAQALLAGPHPESGALPEYSAAKGFNFTLMHRALINGVCISDCRFPNEVKAIHAAGGVVWKTTHGSGLAGAAGQHESERHIDSLEVDAVVPDGAIEALPMIVTTMLKETMR